MPNTIAEIIEEKSEELRNRVGSPVRPEQSLAEQATMILNEEKKMLQELGKNFLVPKKNQLPSHLRIEFNKFLVEPLLQEASLLLDRCLQQRKEYRELETKWFEAFVQIDELLRLSEITKQEEEKIYGLRELTAQADLESLESEKAGAEHSKMLLEKLSNSWVHHTLEAKHFRVATEYSTAYCTFLKNDPNTAPDVGGNRPVWDWAKDNANHLVEIERGVQKSFLDVQLADNEQSISTLDKKIEGAKNTHLLRLWENKFQRQRNEIARLVAIQRAEQLVKPNGALNFNEQRKPLLERYQNDFWAAWLRLSSVVKGLREIYKYEIDEKIFPVKGDDFLTYSDDDTELRINFDKIVSWTQWTNTWLASFLDKQQQVTRSFSLRKLIASDAVFDAGKKVSTWRFKLKDTHFANMSFVRLRSFAVQIDSGQQSGNWNVSVTPPPRAKNDPIEQGHIGTLYLGRVNERTFAVISEGSAPPKLFNASPIGEDSSSGEWIIEVLSSTTSGVTVNDIKDIDIHLTVAVV